MWLKINPGSGVPIYIQLMEQIKHSIAIGSIRTGDQLPTIRNLAHELVINPNTVARVYRELEFEKVLELRHGAGVFVADRPANKDRSDMIQAVQPHFRKAVEQGTAAGMSEEQMRALFESEIDRSKSTGRKGK